LARRKYDFAELDKVKALLWCARHCCLCGKAAGVGIEVAHLDPRSSDLDNAISLCFDCHGAVGHYNPEHPRGRKYNIRELKARREQVYEQHTRHLVPPVLYFLVQKGEIERQLPDVGFHISNLGNTYPVRARVQVTLAQGSRVFSWDAGHYSGKVLWNLNPGFGVNGHFDASRSLSEPVPLRARVDVTLIDIYEREHKLLPVGYVHRLGASDDWYLEPSEEELGISLSAEAVERHGASA
jgi:hypothetical protein